MAGCNRLVLSAQLVERGAVRYTPAGVAALDLRLAHAGEVTEAGLPRKVALDIKARAVGEITHGLMAQALGSSGQFSGFLSSSKNGRGLQFHITAFELDRA